MASEAAKPIFVSAPLSISLNSIDPGRMANASRMTTAGYSGIFGGWSSTFWLPCSTMQWIGIDRTAPIDDKNPADENNHLQNQLDEGILDKNSNDIKITCETSEPGQARKFNTNVPSNNFLKPLSA